MKTPFELDWMGGAAEQIITMREQLRHSRMLSSVSSHRSGKVCVIVTDQERFPRRPRRETTRWNAPRKGATRTCCRLIRRHLTVS